MTLADAIEPLAGQSGWVGAGLLGLVLSWLLLVHLPNKDKQLTTLWESWDKRLSEKDAYVREMAKEFRIALDLVVQHCQEEAELFRQTVMRSKMDPIERKREP